MLHSPANNCVAHWYKRKLGTMMGIVTGAAEERIGAAAAEGKVRMVVHDEPVSAREEVLPGVSAPKAVADGDPEAVADAGNVANHVVRFEVADRRLFQF